MASCRARNAKGQFMGCDTALSGLSGGFSTIRLDGPAGPQFCVVNPKGKRVKCGFSDEAAASADAAKFERTGGPRFAGLFDSPAKGLAWTLLGLGAVLGIEGYRRYRAEQASAKAAALIKKTLEV